MGVTIYGIRNCDTMKKARAWLAANGVDHAFHDYRKDGIERERLETWTDALGWEELLNRSGTTFRKLPDDRKTELDAARAVQLMLEQPAMIRRPVLETEGAILVGFRPERYAAAFRR